MRLFWKILLASLGSLLLCTVLLTAIVSYREARNSLARLRAEQQLLATTAASQVETGYYDQVWPFEMLAGIARDTQFVAWQIVDGRGVVVLSSTPPENGLSRDVEITTQAQLVTVAESHREYWVIPMRMRDGPHPWQFRLGYHTEAIDTQIRSIMTTNALIGLGLAILCIGTSLFLTHRVLRPLNSLTRAVGELEHGNLDVSLPPTSGDELGQLVTGFRAMVGSIKERDAKINEHLGSLELGRAELETRVALRTSELNTSELRTRAIIQYAADAIITLDDRGHIEVFNPVAARIFGCSPGEAIGEPFASFIPEPYRVRFDALDIESSESGVAIALGSAAEIHGCRRNRESFPMHIALSEVNVADRRLFIAIVRDISDRKRAEAERQELHERLVAASRQAGMAEVAISVLHNVGNVLNSVNVSANIVNDSLLRSRMTGLSKATALFGEHRDDLCAYLTLDERGRLLPEYLEKLGAALVDERLAMLEELSSLTGDIEHIKEIVKSQQSYAKVHIDVRELVELEALVEDAVRISGHTIAAEHVELVRDHDPAPRVTLDRHKIVQILVNLLNNAKQAVAKLDTPARIRLRTAARGAAVHFEVTDNGLGIDPANLLRIFNHGFTTRPDGHGFGLHGAALAAAKMGGSLTAHSEGIGLGARFTLVLPVDSAVDRAA